MIKYDQPKYDLAQQHQNERRVDMILTAYAWHNVDVRLISVANFRVIGQNQRLTATIE